MMRSIHSNKSFPMKIFLSPVSQELCRSNSELASLQACTWVLLVIYKQERWQGSRRLGKAHGGFLPLNQPWLNHDDLRVELNMTTTAVTSLSTNFSFSQDSNVTAQVCSHYKSPPARGRAIYCPCKDESCIPTKYMHLCCAMIQSCAILCLKEASLWHHAIGKECVEHSH